MVIETEEAEELFRELRQFMVQLFIDPSQNNKEFVTSNFFRNEN